MKLRGIEFGNILDASGARGFFGEGYWYHEILRPFGLLDFSGVTFVAKTTTVDERSGHMELKPDFTPRRMFPDCIRVKLLLGAVLNAVSLSGFGLKRALDTGRWQARRSPFMISLMSVADTREARFDEMRRMVGMLGSRKSEFRTQFGVQVNVSCPNTDHDTSELAHEVIGMADIVGPLDVPNMFKFSIATAPFSVVMELDQHPACDAICVSNTVKFGWPGIDWKRAWGTTTSPLAKYGGGGYSGPALLPLVTNWIAKLRDMGFQKPINGGGGIQSRYGVDMFHAAGASSIFTGTVAMVRPWRLPGIARYANSLNWS